LNLTKGSHTCSSLANNSILIFGREGSLRIQRKYGNCFLLKGSPASLSFTYEELELNTASRSGHAALNIDKNHIMIIGGRKDRMIEIHSFPTIEKPSLVKQNLESYLESLILDKNSELKSLKNDPGGRRFFAAIKMGDLCLIHAGETFDSHFRDPQHDLLLLHMPSMKWYNLGGTGVSLQNHSCVKLCDKVIIHGGLGLKNSVNDITYELCTYE